MIKSVYVLLTAIILVVSSLKTTYYLRDSDAHLIEGKGLSLEERATRVSPDFLLVPIMDRTIEARQRSENLSPSLVRIFRPIPINSRDVTNNLQLILDAIGSRGSGSKCNRNLEAGEVISAQKEQRNDGNDVLVKLEVKPAASLGKQCRFDPNDLPVCSAIVFLPRGNSDSTQVIWTECMVINFDRSRQQQQRYDILNRLVP